jgi:hypothetical protein
MKRSMCGIIAMAVALAGCAGASVAPVAPAANALGAARLLPAIKVPRRLRRGIYVSTFFNGVVYGYPIDNERNRPPECTVGGVSYPVDIAVDGKGNLIVPDSGSRTVTVFSGPRMCGPELGSFNDPFGEPADVAGNDAADGPIAVATSDTGGYGSVAVCTISGRCKNLTNPNMGEVAGVAMARNGDCWASASSSTGAATLTYFRRCAGAGQAATGFKNTYYGGLDVDIHGNLLSIDAFAPALWIYRGCDPACTVVGGPLRLHGAAVFGHLNARSTEFAAADYACGCVDVYAGNTGKLTYKYSFSNGLGASNDVEGVAYSPRSKE